jgi:hypothetical protein
MSSRSGQKKIFTDKANPAPGASNHRGECRAGLKTFSGPGPVRVGSDIGADSDIKQQRIVPSLFPKINPSARAAGSV